MTTYGDFFSGFGGMTIGAKAAGLDVLFGVEYDEKLADVYRVNLGDHVVVADVTTLDIDALPAVDVFHASPPCTSASVANANAGETPQDMEMARAVCRYIETKRPSVFTLENVYQYRNFESWHEIARTLLDVGYSYNYWHVNMADYGVPQTRKRMIAVARRDGESIQMPSKTHAANPTPGLFGTKARWVSWYEAVEDLITTLPDSHFAPWQINRLPDELMTRLFNGMDMKSTGRNMCGRTQDEPSATVVSTDYRRPSTIPVAYLIDGKLSSSGDVKSLQIDGPHKPSGTVVSSPSAMRGVRAFVDARVVKMTPRALARFQSFPDWYVLPDSDSLAAQGIGNAVPPLFAQKLYEEINHAND